MAEALEAEAADVPDGPQEVGPFGVTTQGKVGKSAILSQERPREAPDLGEALLVWYTASSTQSGGYSR
ncbi:hypothetical protein CFE70_009481 [Pyrenophora teres f. teres 0-1]